MDTAYAAWSNNNNDNPVVARKRDNQGTSFGGYINPELKNFVTRQFANITDFRMLKEGDYVLLIFPKNDPNIPNLADIMISIQKDNYKVSKNLTDQWGNKNYVDGGEHYLPQDVLTKLPNIIKRIQADMRGEKSLYNPAKPIPAPQPEPTPEPIPQEPVQQKPRSFMDRIKNFNKE